MKAINKLSNLLESQGFKIERGHTSDNSCDWIIYRKQGSNIFIEFSFDDKGKTLSDINIWKDITQVVDQKKLM